MSEWGGFESLDLSGVDTDSEVPRLQPGAYICLTDKCRIEKTKQGGGHKFVLELHEENGLGTIMDSINIHNASERAQEIGLRRLKTLLTCAGHPTPENPKDVQTCNKLRVGVRIELESWRDQNGRERQSPRPAQFNAYFSPDKAGGDGGIRLGPNTAVTATRASNGSAGTSDKGDPSIPF